MYKTKTSGIVERPTRIGDTFIGTLTDLAPYGYYTVDTPKPPLVDGIDYEDSGGTYNEVAMTYTPMWSQIVVPIPPVVVPQSITKLQAMRAMKQTDVNTVNGTSMWTNFQSLLASNVDANDEWLLALDLQRDYPLVLALTPALGKTDAQIDELFILASGL